MSNEQRDGSHDTVRIGKRTRVVGAIVVGCLLGLALGGGAATVLYLRHERTLASAQAATPPAVCRPIACSNLGSLPAPDYRLVDQRGRDVSMTSLRGKTIVLEFMDPVCTAMCPIVSAEFARADRQLGPLAHDAEFLAINVNQYRESVADVHRYSERHGMLGLANWHFLTGTTARLERVWHDYRITVIPNPSGDVQHTSIMYFIDAAGHIRYSAFPLQSKASIGTFAKTISDTVRQMIRSR